MSSSPPPDPLAPIPEAGGLGRHLADGFLKANGLVGGGVAIIVGIVVATFKPDDTLKLWIATIVFFLMGWVILALLTAARAAVVNAREMKAAAEIERTRYDNEVSAREKDRLERAKPVVEAAVQPFSPYKQAACVFIVRWPPLSALPMGAQVIISHADQTHERPLGGGHVRPPQQDGKSVVTLDTPNEDAMPLIKALLEGSSHAEAVQKIRIGPWFDLQKLQHIPPVTSTGSVTGTSATTVATGTMGPGVPEAVGPERKQ